MALLHIKSGNTNLSYLIQKNPQSTMFVRSVKQGLMFGYYPKVNGAVLEQEYIIYFKDASDQISYKQSEEESFEYLNASKYNNARFINDAIQEVLHSAREKENELDVPAIHTVSVNLVETHYKTIAIFQRYFPEVTINSEEVSKDNYSLKFISAEPMKFRRMLQIINLFSIFATLNSRDSVYISEDLIKKYVRIANEIDAPYFIRYLIKIRMARTPKKFLQFKEELEKTNRYKVEMVYGDTHQMRIDWISTHLILTTMDEDKRTHQIIHRPIVDIGTGIDFRYLKLFAPILQNLGLKYYAIERDFDARERIKAGLRNRNLLDTVELFESVDDFIEFYENVEGSPEVDVICTEVLEHNKYVDACKIVKQVTDKVLYTKFIITVPNKDFNQYYGLEEGFRHDDHNWEADEEAVHGLVPSGLNGQLFHVGDMVNDSPVTYGLIIYK